MQTRSNTDTQLKQQTKDTPMFSFVGQTVIAKIVYVVDGDTVDVVFNFQDKFQKFRLRLNGINTPETKGVERPLGLYVKQYVNNDLLDKIVTLKLYHFDNFGRIVADIYASLDRIKEIDSDFINYNEHLVSVGYASIYEFRKQHVWDIDTSVFIRPTLRRQKGYRHLI
jgi:micrococcal nuclease